MQTNDRTTHQLLGAMFGLMTQVRQAVFDDPVERPAIILLARLKDRGAMRLSDLAAELCLDISTTSRQVRTLEDRGYLERSEDPADRRAVQVTVAEPGRKVLAAAWDNRRAWIDRSLASWPAKDRRALADVLTRFVDALAADAARPPAPADGVVREEAPA